MVFRKLSLFLLPKGRPAKYFDIFLFTLYISHCLNLNKYTTFAIYFLKFIITTQQFVIH